MSSLSSRISSPNAYQQSLGASPFPQHRLMISEADGVWHAAVVARLEELVHLEHGWDGYNGRSVSLDNAFFALKMLEATCREDTPAPQIVPGSNGDIQIEWHTMRGDVELLVRGPNSVCAWRYLVGADEDGEEMELTNDFLAVAMWIKNVTEPEVAAHVIAA